MSDSTDSAAPVRADDVVARYRCTLKTISEDQSVGGRMPKFPPVPRPGTLVVAQKLLRFAPFVAGAPVALPLKEVEAVSAVTKPGPSSGHKPPPAPHSENNAAAPKRHSAGPHQPGDDSSAPARGGSGVFSSLVGRFRRSSETPPPPQESETGSGDGSSAVRPSRSLKGTSSSEPTPSSAPTSSSSETAASRRESAAVGTLSPMLGLDADDTDSLITGIRVRMKGGEEHTFSSLSRANAAEAYGLIEHLWTQALQFRLASAQSQFETLQQFNQPGIFDTELHSSEWVDSQQPGGERATGAKLVRSVKEQRSFRALFRLPPEERLAAKFEAWLALTSNEALRGHLFVSVHFLCYFTRDAGHELAVVTPLSHITGVQYQIKEGYGGVKLRLELIPYDLTVEPDEAKAKSQAKRRIRMFGMDARSTVACSSLLISLNPEIPSGSAKTPGDAPSSESPPAAPAEDTAPPEEVAPAVAMGDLISFDDDPETPTGLIRSRAEVLEVHSGSEIDDIPGAQAVNVLPPCTSVRWPDHMLADREQFSEEFQLRYAASRNDGPSTLVTTGLSGDEEPQDILLEWRTYLRRYGCGISMVRLPEKLSELVHRGVPECLRGDIWAAFVGALACHHSYPSGYYRRILHEHKEQTSHSIEEIEKDLTRSFPEHPYFASGDQAQTPVDGQLVSENCGPGIDPLRRVLVAYSWRNEKLVGYCQSMNIVASFLLVYMNEEAVFWSMAILCERLVPEYYHRSLTGAVVDFRILSDALLPHFLPDFYDLLMKLDGDGMLALGIQPWFLCFFIGYVPHELALRILDLVFYYDRDMLLCAALSILKYKEDELMGVQGPDDVMIVARRPIPGDSKTVESVVGYMIQAYTALPRARIAELRNSQQRAAIENIESANLKRTLGEMCRETRFNTDGASELFGKFNASQSLEVANYIEFEQFLNLFDAVFPAHWQEISGLSDRVFETFDRHHRGRIDFRDFLVGLDPVVNGTTEERLQFCFDLYGGTRGAVTETQLMSVVDAFLALMVNLAAIEDPAVRAAESAEKLQLFASMVFAKNRQPAEGEGTESEPVLTFAQLKAIALDVPLLVATFHLHDVQNVEGEDFAVM
jgi:Rab-GTPase-TBC domain